MNTEVSNKKRKRASSSDSRSSSSSSSSRSNRKSHRKDKHSHHHNSRSRDRDRDKDRDYNKSKSHHHHSRKKDKNKKNDKHKHSSKEHSKHSSGKSKSKKSTSSSHSGEKPEIMPNSYFNYLKPGFMIPPMQGGKYPFAMNIGPQIPMPNNNFMPKMDNNLPQGPNFPNSFMMPNQNLMMGNNTTGISATDAPTDKIVKDQNFLNSDDKLFESIVNSEMNEKNIFAKCQFSEKLLGSVLYRVIKKHLFDSSVEIYEEEKEGANQKENENIIEELGSALIDKKIENLNQKSQKFYFGDLQQITDNLLLIKQKKANQENNNLEMKMDTEN